MRKAAQFHQDTTDLDEALGPLRLWLADLFLFVVQTLGAEKLPRILQRALTATEDGLRHYIFVKAVNRCAIRAPRWTRRLHHAHTRIRRRDALRAFIGHHLSAPKRSTLSQRIAHLRALLDNLEPHIAKLATRLQRIRLSVTRLLYARHFSAIALSATPIATAYAADTS